MINKKLAKINQYIDNNQNIDSNIIFEILVNLIKSHNQAYVFLEEVYFSKKSIEEQKKYSNYNEFKKMYDIRVKYKKKNIFIADILDDNQKIQLLKLSIKTSCVNMSHPLNYWLLPTKFKHNPELIFYIVKYYGYYVKKGKLIEFYNINEVQEEILVNYIKKKIIFDKVAKNTIEKILKSINFLNSLSILTKNIILDYLAFDKNNEFKKMLFELHSGYAKILISYFNF